MARRSGAASGPTINDLAQRLGVHKSTVARAMNPARRRLIGAELLLRVEAAAREPGWRPKRAAAALSTGRSRTVGVLLPDITNPVFPPMLRGIEDALDREGCFALPAVTSDAMPGMRLAVHHLVGLGHRRIAHLAGPAGFSTGQARRIGFQQALKTHGPAPAALLACAAYSIEAGAAGMAQLLVPAKTARRTRRTRARDGAAPAFTAVVAANDLLTLGALQVLQQHGLAVPQAMSLMGHNDMPLLAQTSPPLCSVRIQHDEMGFRAARLLLEALQGVPGTASTLVLQPTLVVCGSTGPAPV